MRARPAMLASVGLVALATACYSFAATGRGGPDDAHPVVVGPLRISATAIEAQARGGNRPAAADLMIETAWLRAEAATRRIRVDEQAVERAIRRGASEAHAWLRVLRAQVADALSGPRAEGIPAAFERFHERHRATTRCLATHQEGFADRCGDRPPALQGRCRWMGDSTLCELTAGGRRPWLVVVESPGRRPTVRRVARRRAAIALARTIHLQARTTRERRARRAGRARQTREGRERRLRVAHERRAQQARRAQVRRERRARVARERRERRARAEAERRSRLAVARLSAGTLQRALPACASYRRAAEPYSFGVGLQDPEGHAAGLLAARVSLRRRLAGTGVDGIDRSKLAPLLRHLRSGDRELVRVRQAATAGALEELERALRRLAAAIGRETHELRRLGLGRCVLSARS